MTPVIQKVVKKDTLGETYTRLWTGNLDDIYSNDPYIQYTIASSWSQEKEEAGRKQIAHNYRVQRLINQIDRLNQTVYEEVGYTAIGEDSRYLRRKKRRVWLCGQYRDGSVV